MAALARSFSKQLVDAERNDDDGREQKTHHKEVDVVVCRFERHRQPIAQPSTMPKHTQSTDVSINVRPSWLITTSLL